MTMTDEMNQDGQNTTSTDGEATTTEGQPAEGGSDNNEGGDASAA